VPICCWGGGIIYVDPTAAGGNIGTSWTDAYTDLQQALARAAAGCGAEIRVAQGVYDPGRKAETTFAIPDEVFVYGGFCRGGCGMNQRNPDRYPTILTGAAETERNGTVVTMGNHTRLDGFSIEGASLYGIYGSGIDFVIENCLIMQNIEHGVKANNSNVILKWCKIRENGKHGISHAGEGYTISINNCQIIENNWHGIISEYSTPFIKNCIVSNNGFYNEGGYQGIAILLPLEAPVLYNNTIVYNKLQGLLAINNNPNDPNLPDIQNCILWYNNENGKQTAGFDANTLPQYCCIYDPITDPNGIDYTLKTNDNFSGAPGFAYSDPNNPHLAYDSPCKDMGNPSHTTDHVGLYDMDGEDRIVGNRVDIGADEVYACRGLGNEDIYNALDWNADGQVNYAEFTDFSRAWLSYDPNVYSTDPNVWNTWVKWGKKCDLYDDEKIDLRDLETFISDTPWLWRACWKQSQLTRFETLYYSQTTENLFFESSDVSFSSSVTGNKDIKISELNTMEKSIVQILTVVEQSIQKDREHPNIEGLAEIRAFLEDCLVDIRSRK
jgi:hypothetical protein